MPFVKVVRKRANLGSYRSKRLDNIDCIQAFGRIHIFDWRTTYCDPSHERSEHR